PPRPELLVERLACGCRRRRRGRRRSARPSSGRNRGGARAARALREHRLWRDRAEELQELGDESRPAGLVAGTDAGTVVAMEVLVERDVVAALAGVGETLRLGVAVHAPAA